MVLVGSPLPLPVGSRLFPLPVGLQQEPGRILIGSGWFLLLPEGQTAVLPALFLLLGLQGDILHLALQLHQFALQLADLVLLGADVALPHHMVEGGWLGGGVGWVGGEGRNGGAFGFVEVGSVA